jgi:hypothetical protein
MRHSLAEKKASSIDSAFGSWRGAYHPRSSSLNRTEVVTVASRAQSEDPGSPSK